jgi:hypothetical protein
VCTKEACQFNDNLAGFQASGVSVIGISRRWRTRPGGAIGGRISLREIQ